VLEKLRLVVAAKKNPILLTILTENLITFSSTMIPLLCQILYYFSPTSLWSIVGGLIIGMIQMRAKKRFGSHHRSQKLQIGLRVGNRRAQARGAKKRASHAS